MKNLLMTLALAFFAITGSSQTLTQKKFTTSRSVGYYEFLPAGYSATKTYPTIIFIHGLGETSDKGPLTIVLRNGLPMYLNQGGAYRDTAKFIMIAPQFSSWPSANDLEEVIAYTKANYQVDHSRVYLTGLSMGGGVTWAYMGYNEDRSSKIAAIVPVCGAYGPDSYGMGLIANLGIPTWATHNADDGTVGVNLTNGWVNGINARAPKVPAIKTIWPTGGHNAWSRTFDPNSKEFAGGNITDWMLKQQRGGIITPALPTAYKLTTGTVPGWTSDAAFVTQTTGWGYNTMGINVPIIGTTEQLLYNYERFGDMKYSLPIANGTYTLKFHFAELFFNQVGKRVFHIDVNGARFLTNFDIVKEAGRYATAIQRTVDVDVTNGKIEIDFIPVTDQGKLTALEVYEASGPIVIPPYRKIIIVDYLDSATGTLNRSRTDTFSTPTKAVIRQ